MVRCRRALAAALVSSACSAWALHAAIYLTNSGADARITVHANGANGNSAPLRWIAGAATGLSQPSQLWADVVHGELYVADQSDHSIRVYPLAASGDQPPLRTLKGAATLLDEPAGVAVDVVHDELVVVSFDDGHNGSVTVYPRTASGNAAPLRRIAGAATGLAWAIQVALDPEADEIFVVCQGNFGGGVPAGVRVFPRTANGDVAPLRAIAGFATLIEVPFGIALDQARGEIFVTDREGAINVFRNSDTGNVAPLRRIAGAQSELLETYGVALVGGSEIVVANAGQGGNDHADDAVLVFPRTGSGDLAPSRRIQGPATQINGPEGVAVVSPPLLLRSGRFGVQAVFRTTGGAVGDGTPVALTSDTGYQWFFQSSNVEIVVKVLNGCAINNRYWVFAGGLTDTQVDLVVTDHATGAVRVYTNPQKTAFQPIQDTAAFASCPSPSAIGRDLAAGRAPSRLAGVAASGRTSQHAAPAALDGDDSARLAERVVSGDALLLNGGRFRVTSRWETAAGAMGIGHPAAITGDTGYFWFFDDQNVEVVVKVLDGCGINQRFWVFAGGLTDVYVELEVEDLAAGTTSKTYVNPQKAPFQPIQDTSAFATCT